MAVSAANSWNADASRAGALDQRFALDVQGVDALKRVARNSPDEGLQQVSRQFEAMFMSMVLKSMREATPSSGLLENRNEKLYKSMFDQQLTQNLSGRGMGLAEAMLAQLRKTISTASDDTDGDGAAGMSLLQRGFPIKPQSGIPLGSAPTTGTSRPVPIGRARGPQRLPGQRGQVARPLPPPCRGTSRIRRPHGPLRAGARATPAAYPRR